MATSRRTARKHTQLEQIYGKYRAAEPAASSAGAEPVKSTTPKISAQPYLTAEEAAFVRRDLRRVGLAAAVALLLIVGAWIFSGQPGWSQYVEWVGRATNF